MPMPKRSIKDASEILAPQLVDALLDFEDFLNTMDSEQDTSPDRLNQAIESVRTPIWWLTEVMNGADPDYGLKVDAPRRYLDGQRISDTVAKDLGRALDKACGRLVDIRAERRSLEDTWPKVLQDVRSIANAIRQELGLSEEAAAPAP